MFKNILQTVFRLSVLGFLLGGLAVVVLQAAGLIAGSGDFVDAVSDQMAPWAYGSAGVAGLLAFALSYFPHGDDDDENLSSLDDHVSPRPAQVPELA